MTRDRPGLNRPVTAPPLPLEQFQDLLDAYGAAPRRWPADRQAAALALLERSAAARRAREDAARLDALLDLVPAEAPSADLRARILSVVPTAAVAAEPAAAAPVAAAPAMASGDRRASGVASRRLGWAGWRVGTGRSPARAPAAAAWPGGASWRPAMALAASLVLGLAIGYASPPSFLADGGEETSATTASDLAFGIVSSGDQLL